MNETTNIAADWEENGFVSLWAGTFDSEKMFDDYIFEHYGNLEEGKPLSPFSDDFALGWYDHDSREALYLDPTVPHSVRELLIDMSYSASFIDLAEKAAEEQGIKQANAVFLLYNCRYRPHQQVEQSEGRKLNFIAAFPYDFNAPPALS